MKRVTISDVAEKAGVSKSTVSHALSGKRPISAATRARIAAAVDELGYAPNPAAQRLAGGQTNTIGFVFPLYSPQLSGMEMRFITNTARVISEAGYTFMMITPPVEDVAGLRRVVNAGVADGYILMQGWADDPRVPLLEQAGVPFVMVGRSFTAGDAPFVEADMQKGVDLCVDHIAACGHTHIAYIHPYLTATSFHQQTEAALQQVCRRHQLTLHLQACDLGFESGSAAMAQLLADCPQVTAVIIWNSPASWGAIQLAQEQGRAVPQDLSVLTIGHAEMGSHLPLALTVLDTKPEAIAAGAANLLLDLLQGDERLPRQQIVSPELIVRDSTGHCAGHAGTH